MDPVRQSKKRNFGFDAQAGVFTDLVQAGVIDPAKVTRLALQNAASIAGVMLSTERLISGTSPEKTPQHNMA